MRYESLLFNDDNSNLLSDGRRDFEWDAENRLVKVTNQASTPATVTDFTYDGFSRRVRIKSMAGAAVLSDARYLWAGSQIAEERDPVGVVTKRFFSNGVQVAGGNLFYQYDHLGSIRGLADSNGAVRGAYDFDLWGRRTRLTGDIDADFGFTGHLENGATGLTLAWFRGYDSGMGRWVSRDPIYELDGLNLYSYVHGNPVNFVDPLGLCAPRPQPSPGPTPVPTPPCNSMDQCEQKFYNCVRRGGGASCKEILTACTGNLCL